jgi:hypothetical protein
MGNPRKTRLARLPGDLVRGLFSCTAGALVLVTGVVLVARAEADEFHRRLPH